MNTEITKLFERAMGTLSTSNQWLEEISHELHLNGETYHDIVAMSENVTLDFLLSVPTIDVSFTIWTKSHVYGESPEDPYSDYYMHSLPRNPGANK